MKHLYLRILAVVVVLVAAYTPRSTTAASATRTLKRGDFSGYAPSKTQFIKNAGAATIANRRFARGIQLETYGGSTYAVTAALEIAGLAGFHAVRFWLGMEDRTGIDHVAHFSVAAGGTTVLQRTIRKGASPIEVTIPFAHAQTLTFSAFSVQGNPSYVLLAEPTALRAGRASINSGGSAERPVTNRYIKKTELAGIDNINAAYVTASIGRTRYPHSLRLLPCGGATYTVGASINTHPFKRYRTLRTVVGMAGDAAPGTSTQVLVFADNRSVFSRRLLAGDTGIRLVLPVKGVEAYSFKAYQSPTTGQCNTAVLFGGLMAAP